MKLYLAGPMRGHELYNFPEFDAIAETLRSHGHEVVSPAEMDRAIGFDEHTDVPDEAFIRDALKRDFQAIQQCDAVALLDNWQQSEGTLKELAHADMWCKPHGSWVCFARGVSCLSMPLEAAQQTVCEEANAITQDARHDDYGHPRDNFEHTAALWRAMFGWPVEWYDVARAMVLVKLSRQRNKPKRDNCVDIAGYAQCEQMGWERDA